MYTPSDEQSKIESASTNPRVAIGLSERLRPDPPKEDTTQEIEFHEVAGNFEISSFLDSLSARMNFGSENFDLRAQGRYNPTLWFGDSNEWKIYPGGGRKFKLTMALIWIVDPNSEWSINIRVNLPKLLNSEEPEIKAIVDAMLSSPKRAIELFREMNPCFTHYNEFWGYYSKEFSRWACAIKPLQRNLSRVRRPQRKRGYTDQGAKVKGSQADKYIRDTLAMKREEERENSYYRMLFFILEKYPP